MTIIGTNFTEISVKKEKPIVKGLKINNNLSIKTIEKADLNLGSTQESLKFVFEYTTTYEPKVATIKLIGEVLMIEKKENAEKIIKQWSDKKPVDEAIMTRVMNMALTKSTIKSLMFAQDLNLPSPIKLPRIVQKQ